MAINVLCLLFLGTVGWGVSLFLIKILLLSLTPADIVLYRMVIGTVTLFLLACLLRLKIQNLKRLMIDGAVFGTFNMSIPFYLTTYAETHVSSSLAAIMNGMTPLFTFLINIAIFSSDKKFTLISFSSILLGLIGVIVIHLDSKYDQASTMCLLALVLTTLSYGIAANYGRSCARTSEPILLSGMAALISSLTMLWFHVVNDSLTIWRLPTGGWQLISLLWLGIIGSGISLYVYTLLIKRAGAVFASMITYLMAVTGVILGVLFLGEHFSNTTVLGCTCLIGSLILINHRERFGKINLSFLTQKM